MQNFDDIIIGFGKGGKTIAAALAGKGRRVAMVEKSDRMYGGTCINIACIPTKTLVHEAKALSGCAERDFAQKAADYARAVARKDEVTGFLRQKNLEMLTSRGVTVLTGQASFVSPHEVEVRFADGRAEILHGEDIYINTGAYSVIPPIEGLAESANIYTSTSLLDLTRLPRRLLILGAGYIALEMASMYAKFGSSVTMLEYSRRFLPREDADMAQSVRAALEAQGVDIHLGCGPPSRISGLWATSRAACSSPIFPWTTSALCGTRSGARANATPATGGPWPTPCSWTRPWPAWASAKRKPAPRD